MAKNTIFAGDVGNSYRPRQQEAKTTQADILPGMLVVRSSGSFVKHATAGQGGDFFIAKENSAAQEGVDVTYANGDTVFAYQPDPNQLFNIAIAASQNITAVGTPITSNGAGYGRIALTTGAEEVLFYTEEIVNVSTAGTLVRCRVAVAGFSGLV